MDLRYNIPLEAAHIINAPIELDDMGITGAVRIKPGAADSSVLLLRMLDLGQDRMPSLATSLIDQEGTKLIRDWIDTLGVALNIDEGLAPNIPEQFRLYPAYPNPFNPSTNIKFTLPKPEIVTLKVYNVLGEEVTTLISKKLQAGNHTYKFDGNNLASGVYLYRITAGEFQQVRKMLLIK